jgi:pantoate--beta-alanine ligase
MNTNSDLSGMQTVSTVAAVRAQVRAWRAAGQRVALVPTMGNLHAGHMSLLDLAHQRGDRVVVSIFVNPLQFGPGEDYGRYPRTLEDDAAMLRTAGCDLLFTPSVDELYTEGGSQRTLVSVRGLSEVLCGEFRPGHFDGVATVVAKLFGVVAPDVAIFGEKDFQQFRVVQLMTRDLALPVEVVGAPTVRAADGLALSSRNQYLTAGERARAPAVYAALQAAGQALVTGRRDFAVLEAQGRMALGSAGITVDYFAVRDAADLAAPRMATREFVVLTAARLGRARLIDNIRVTVPTTG